ncbi:MAG TPA: response regulator [Azospirillaceae bacterium]|nr:response regulator [Azospirillaceae bacterium]
MTDAFPFADAPADAGMADALRLPARIRRLEEVVRTQAMLADTQLDLGQFMQLVVDRMQALTGCKGAVVELVEGEEMVYRAASAAISANVGLRLKRRGSLSGLCVERREVLLCRDSETDDRVDREACRRVGVRAMVCAPLFEGGRAVGVLKVMATEADAFTGDDVSLLELMAGALGAALGKQVAFEEKCRQAEAMAALAEERDRARAAAEAASQAKSAFLATMSHEIRTPMNGVMGMAQLLAGTPLDAEQKGYVQSIQESGEALLAVINDILDISKLEAGKVELEAIDFDLNALVEGVAMMLSPRAAEKRLDLACFVEEGARGSYRGDPTRLRQVLVNLAGNAVKFTEAGSVALEVRARAEGEDALLRFTVTDTGIGLTDEQRGRLFQIFGQADDTISRRFGGTGLGLAISRQLVELMGGEIGVESRPGEGSCFWFALRLPRAAAALATPAEVAERLRGLRVLVVDDVPLHRRVLLQTLESFGIAARAVEEPGAAAAELDRLWAAGTPPDMVMIDYSMAAVRGDELGRALRADGRLSETKLVLISAFGAMDRAVADRDVFDGVLSKPVRRQPLQDLLASLFLRQVAPAAPGPAPAAPRRGGRVLLVEDNRINRQVALIMLQREGHEVVCAEDGAQALAMLAELPVDLVLMDVQMPVMDGLEATRRIRAVEGTGRRRVPVVALTANAMAGMEARFAAAGMDDFLPKPYDRRRFLETVRRWIDGAAPAAAPEPAAAGPVLFDEAPLGELEALAEQEMFEELVRGMVANGNRRLDRLAALGPAGDLQALRREAHDLISTAGTAGLRRLQQLGERLHEAAADGDTGTAQAVAAEAVTVGREGWSRVAARFLASSTAGAGGRA